MFCIFDRMRFIFRILVLVALISFTTESAKRYFGKNTTVEKASDCSDCDEDSEGSNSGEEESEFLLLSTGLTELLTPGLSLGIVRADETEHLAGYNRQLPEVVFLQIPATPPEWC